jgi:hypothetical protein
MLRFLFCADDLRSSAANAPEANMTNQTGSLDFTRTAPARLRALGASTNFFAALVGTDSGTASNIFSGKKKINGQKTADWNQMLNELEKVQRAFSPAPISFKDPAVIFELIRQLNSGDLLIGKMIHGSLEIHGQDTFRFGAW